MEYGYYEEEFKKRYNGKPLLVRAPGRINVIGEHTDYNDGFVLPAAVDKETVLAIAKNGTDQIRATALDIEEDCTFSVKDLRSADKSWAKYIAGVVHQLQKVNPDIGGFDCVFGGTIPMGSGMSSSAALECGIGYALNELDNLGLSTEDIAKAGQMAEHEFVGVKCGIMDQFANMFSKKNHVIQLDCRDLSYKYHSADLKDHTLLLFDTQVKHSLGDSEYNIRRQECEKGVEIMASRFEGIKSLRDCTLDMLEQAKGEMQGKVYDRSKYVIEEIARVEKACAALSSGKTDELGALMYQTHKGLSELYQVSCDELDALVETSHSISGIKGARMMGGGFGGCTINLVLRSETEQITEIVRKEYNKKFGFDPKVYQVDIADGTGTVN